MNKDAKYWIAINKIDKLGPIGIRKLYEYFGSIKQAWFADVEELSKVEGLRRDALKSFIENREKINVDEELKKINGIKVLCWEDVDYPSNLKNIYDPPPVLYVKGDLLSVDQKAVAIVGTRKASEYGKSVAYKLAAELAAVGVTVVSGLALGIDSAAHEGALAGGGRTIAVLGSGVDKIYPQNNADLAEKIEKSGAVVSEFSLGAEPEVGFFPRRNRIISGLSLGVIMVEGHYDSGAMITAKYALDQGREVFAVPGNVQIEQSKGPHWLIKQGAKLVEDAQDILDELKFQIPEEKAKTKISTMERNYSNLSFEEQKIISVLSQEPKHLDLISVETELPIAQISGLLMQLEIKKIVRQLPGKMFVLY